MGPHDDEGFRCAAEADSTTDRRTRWPVGPVKTILTADVADRAAEIAAPMGLLAFPNAQMSGILAWQEARGATAEEAAVQFLRTHGDVWPAWLNEAARARFAALTH